jgi:hypothetical protein
LEVDGGWRGLDRGTASTELSEPSPKHLVAASLAPCDSGQHDLSPIYLVSVLDELVQDAGMQYRIKGRDRSARSIIQELAFQGIIDDTTAELLDQAWERRNAIVRGRTEAESLNRDEVLRIVTACRETYAARRLQPA